MTNDIRYACRLLARNPGFAAVAIMTLAIGIGLNGAVFSIFNAMLFKPLPVDRPGRLVWIASASTEPDGPRGNLTYPDFLDLRARREVLEDAFAFTEAPLSIGGGGRAVRLTGQVVTGNMFDVLGVRMAAGRHFLPEEDRTSGTHPVMIISHTLWQRHFGGDPAIVGRPAVVNGQTFSIVGVTAEGFVGPDLLSPSDAWVPLMMHATVLPGIRAASRETWWLKAIGRLAPGATPRQAQGVLSGVAGGIAQAEPTSHKGFFVTVTTFQGTDPADRAQVLPMSALVLGLTLTVLLIACANVAGLLLSRSAGRQREIGIRIAVGATRRALVRQFLVESLIMSALAGCAGLLMALWGTAAMVRFADVPVRVDTAPDWRLLLFTALVSLGAGAAFGLAPALRAAGQNLLPSLRSEPGSDARPRTSRLQRALVIGQLAVSLVLLVGAGLFMRGLSQAWRSDVGFAYRDRVAVSMDLRLQNYEAPRAAAFYVRLLEQVRALPGMRDATFAHLIPFGGRVFSHGLTLPDRPQDPNARPERASVNRVWTGFFSTLQIPIVRGRDFAEADLKAVPDAAIISETMALRYWADAEPLGQRFSVDGPSGPFVTVVGVARDVLIDEFTERRWPAVYLPHSRAAEEISLIAWSPRPPAQTIREIEETVNRLDSDLPLFASRPLSQYVAERLDSEQALSSLLAVCGGLALVLAALGLYGVMAYAVARRTREIGVRMALGAERRDVMRLFVREGLNVAMWGLIWGALPAVAVTFALSGALVGVGAADPPTLAAAIALLVGATLLAAYVPARRATRVDPIVALRRE